MMPGRTKLSEPARGTRGLQAERDIGRVTWLFVVVIVIMEERH